MNSLINLINTYANSSPNISHVKPPASTDAGSGGAMDAFFNSMDSFIETHPVATVVICGEGFMD